MAAPPPLTARYLTRFQCLGASCEDTCCEGWRVPVEERTYQILAKKMDSAELAAGIETTGAAGEPRGLRMREDGACAFLRADRLCSVQARFEAEALPDVCATYPRAIARRGERWEVWGSLSCPEIARLCLLAEDAMELVDAPDSAAPRWVAQRTLPAEPPAPYDRHVDEVRAVGLEVLSARAFPVGTRLFLLAYLGKETSGFFRKDAAAIDEPRLRAAIAHVTAPATMAGWHQELAALPAPRAMTANLLGQLARAPGEAPAFRRLVDAVVASYGPGDAAALWNEYARRRGFWQERFGARIDQYFENYARNFWLREWHTSAIDLLAHAHRLLVRVAALRLLLFGHPGLTRAEALPAGEAQRGALDAAAVEVFYKLSRAVEHGSTFLDRLAATVLKGEAGMQTFAHSTFLTLV